MDDIRIGQLTKEMVAEELRLLGDPCAAAASVLRRTLMAAMITPEDADRMIDESVRGAMTALLLADQSIAKGSLLAIEAVLDVAAERQVDPTVAMRSALRALADMRRFVEPARIDEVRVAIEARYMGAGEVFAEALKSPLPGAPAPKR